MPEQHHPNASAAQPLAGLRILVTAGPTWVFLDEVRYLGNLSSGRTGTTIARHLAAAGASVTLLLGPVRQPSPVTHPLLRVKEFVTFAELEALLRRHLNAASCHALVHAAAVADYRPAAPLAGKISSHEPGLILRLEPTPKLVDLVKQLSPQTLLVKFKLEVGRSREELLKIAEASRAASGAELLVANDLRGIRGERHEAWLLEDTGSITRVCTEEELAELLTRVLARRLVRKERRE